MATRKKRWVYSPPKPTKTNPKVPEEIKRYVQEKSNNIVENIFKPKYIKPNTEGYTSNNIVDIYTKWYRNYFYFCVKYERPSGSYPSSFESKFARFEYLGDDKFQYSYMRHTGQWWPTFTMTIDECLEHVTTEIPC